MDTSKLTKYELTQMINALSQDPIWNVYTRAALELRWNELTSEAVAIAYCDIDHMHDLNSKYGHKGTDDKIKQVIHAVRNNDIVASRWLNGDELIFILKSGNPKNFCIRIMEEFDKVGISCTFSHSSWIFDNAQDTINPLDAKVQNSKNAGIRGIIVE